MTTEVETSTKEEDVPDKTTIKTSYIKSKVDKIKSREQQTQNFCKRVQR